MGSKILGVSRNFLVRRTRYFTARNYTEEADSALPSEKKKGLVIGIYTHPETNEHRFTPAAAKINNQAGGKLDEYLRATKTIGVGKVNLYETLDSDFDAVAVVGLGFEDMGFNEQENLEQDKENVRIATATGVKRLQAQGVEHIFVEGFGHPEAAAEGATLAAWKYQENKNKENQVPIPTFELYFDEDTETWQKGVLKGEAQNLARRLSDTPANLMTPAIFAQNAVDALCPCGITVEIRNKDWIESRNMHALLAVSRGSCEPPVFLELGYCGTSQDEKPVVLVGKGVTFDSGGLCLKPCADMHKFRADMAGAAVIVGVLKGAASLSLPVNIQAVIPLCENMSSGMAMRPGDVVAASNGKTIRIDDTDNEGRLVLADALDYAQTLKPQLLIDIATMTQGLEAALGCAATGVFTNTYPTWKMLSSAGAFTGDRMWLFPLWDHFTQKVVNISSADITNVGRGRGGGPCRAAAFLREFIHCAEWVHLDIGGTGMLSYDLCAPYLVPGRMTGRPTRTLVQFLHKLCTDKQEKQ